MTAIGEKRFAAWDWDLRVRDRHLATGLIEHKEVEQYLRQLPDLETASEVLSVEQPAIGTGAARSAEDRSAGAEEDEGSM
jgi:hypothetical protein